jgi:flagellar protein FlgJ
VLMAKVLNSMRQTIPRSDWMGSSFAMDTFESMLYDEYANLISQSRALGIADVLYRQLSDRLSSAQPPEKSVAD